MRGRPFAALAVLLALAGCLNVQMLDEPDFPAFPGPSNEAPREAKAATAEPARPKGEPVVLTMLDVGWGEAVVVRQGARTALVDVGSDEMARDVVLPYLKKHNVTRIDMMVLTHAHPDHAAGCARIINTLDVERIAHPGRGISSSSWGACMGAAAEAKIPQVTGKDLVEGGQLELFPGLSTTILSAGWGGSTHHEATALNEGSIVLMLDHEGTRVYLAGDGHCTTEARVLKAGHDVRADILKAGHHGEPNGSCEPLLDAAQPDIALVSRSTRLSEEVITRYKEHDIRAYTTRIAGTIEVELSGGEWRML